MGDITYLKRLQEFGLSKQKIATRMRVSRHTVHRWLSGERNMSPMAVELACKIIEELEREKGE